MSTSLPRSREPRQGGSGVAGFGFVEVPGSGLAISYRPARRGSLAAPARARARALTAPMPELPPVTRAVRSCRGRAADEPCPPPCHAHGNRDREVQVLQDLGL